ncbi:MAG: dynamin family protein [Campylobacter sp.]|nr:dynamin family protein [Campylobacter sp.]
MDNFLDKIWGINRLYIDQNLLFKTEPSVAAIVLGANCENFEKFKSLNAFKEILKSLGFEVGIYGVQALQIGIINAIRKLKISKFEILLDMEILKNENIICESEFTRISEFLYGLKTDDFANLAVENSEFAFYKKIDLLNESADKLSQIDENFKNRLQNAKIRANSSNFTVSVTGVINAGKSSMLNALLDFNVLGTSNIPETANLTLLRYGEKAGAKIKFYDENEMQILGFSDKFKDEIAKFKAEFGDKNIEISELINYTSAKNEISKYIKMIEMSLNSEILKDNISIVDTPGLDDTVVLREELTKNFMYESDAIIHLMNASQSSTKKDMSFIVDTLKNSKNNSLMVVLTHTDLLSDKDLTDALKYTRKSIQEELSEYEFDENLISNVSFFCIDSLSKRGISELKNHIYESFFGENSIKAGAILDSFSKEILIVADLMISNLQEQRANLLSGKEEIIAKSEQISKEILALKANLEQLSVSLNDTILKLDYSKSLDFSSLKSAQIVIKDRILSDLRYAKTKKIKPDFDRLKIIATSGLNDCITDIFRSFSQRIAKDSANLKAMLGESFYGISDFKFDTKKFMEENFKKPDFSLMNSNLINTLKSNSDFNALSNELDGLFGEFISGLNLSDEFGKIAKDCTQSFLNEVKEIFKNQEESLKQKEFDLKSALEISGKDAQNALSQAENLQIKLNEVLSIKQRILA